MMAPTEPPFHDSAGRARPVPRARQFLPAFLEVESLEGVPSTLQNTRGPQPDAMEIVRDLQARIEVKKEVMEEEQQEHARRHAQLQSVVEAKIQEAAELRGRLNDIALAFECTLCFETLGKETVSFGCGHTYCNREQEPAAPDGWQVQRLASENAKASLEEIRKRSEEEKAVCKSEKKEMKRKVNRLQEEELAAANAKASLEEIPKRSEEDKAVWQREREEMQQQVNRPQDEVLAVANANASLEEICVQQNDHINQLLNAEKLRTKQVTPELDDALASLWEADMPAERLGKEDALQQFMAEQTKQRLSDGNKEQNAVLLPAAAPPNKKQKQNMPGKACDADSFFAQLAGLSRQGDEAAIIQGMLTHSEHAGVQQQACWALSNLAFNTGNKVKIAEAGGIEAVVAAMKAHTACVLVQDPACRALSNLAFNTGNWVKTAEAGGIEAVVAAMKAHTARVLVQAPACAALSNLAFNDGNKVKIAEAGGIEAILAAMKAHKAIVLVQAPACAALWTLAFNSGNRVNIAEAGGIEAVVAAMKAQKVSVPVQEYACLALWSLAAQGSLRQRIKTAGGVECVKHAVNASNATADTKSWGNDLLDKLK